MISPASAWRQCGHSICPFTYRSTRQRFLGFTRQRRTEMPSLVSSVETWPNPISAKLCAFDLKWQIPLVTGRRVSFSCFRHDKRIAGSVSNHSNPRALTNRCNLLLQKTIDAIFLERHRGCDADALRLGCLPKGSGSGAPPEDCLYRPSRPSPSAAYRGGPQALREWCGLCLAAAVSYRI